MLNGPALRGALKGSRQPFLSHFREKKRGPLVGRKGKKRKKNPTLAEQNQSTKRGGFLFPKGGEKGGEEKAYGSAEGKGKKRSRLLCWGRRSKRPAHRSGQHKEERKALVLFPRRREKKKGGENHTLSSHLHGDREGTKGDAQGNNFGAGLGSQRKGGGQGKACSPGGKKN